MQYERRKDTCCCGTDNGACHQQRMGKQRPIQPAFEGGADALGDKYHTAELAGKAAGLFRCNRDGKQNVRVSDGSDAEYVGCQR